MVELVVFVAACCMIAFISGLSLGLVLGRSYGNRSGHW